MLIRISPSPMIRLVSGCLLKSLLLISNSKYLSIRSMIRMMSPAFKNGTKETSKDMMSTVAMIDLHKKNNT